MQHVIAVGGLAVLCGAWYLVQAYCRRHDPGAPGVEGKCGSCAEPCPTDD